MSAGPPGGAGLPSDDCACPGEIDVGRLVELSPCRTDP